MQSRIKSRILLPAAALLLPAEAIVDRRSFSVQTSSCSVGDGRSSGCTTQHLQRL